jgi:hypothetical protein
MHFYSTNFSTSQILFIINMMNMIIFYYSHYYGNKEILIEAFCSLDMNAGDADPYEVKEMIAEAWDINSKNELINRLESLQMGLHQNVIDELIDLTTNQKIDLNESFAVRLGFR